VALTGAGLLPRLPDRRLKIRGRIAQELAVAGDAGCLARDGAVPTPAAAARPRGRILPRRS